MSRARIGTPLTTACAWSAAYWLMRRPSRGTYVRSTHPEPPPSADPLGAQATERTEVTGGGFRHRLRWLAVPAHASKVELVQQRGIEREQLLALEPVEDVRGRLLEIKRLELLGDGVQAPERAAIIVLVMALDELHREVGQRPGTAVDLLELVAHTSLL